MSTTVLDRPSRPAHRGPQRASGLAGTLRLLRLYLRRDRVGLPLWVMLLSVPLATVYVGSIQAVYPDQAARAVAAAAIMASPAQRALYGPVYNDSLGAVGVWKAGMFHTLIAVAVILTMIRHTRADEETGRAELVESTAVGRYANLTAALLLSFGASVATGAIGAAGLLTTDVPAAGSLAFGAALAASGLVFTSVAAVCAQLSPSARSCRSAAFAVLGTAFTLRAIGDAGSGALSWFSPLGWSLLVRPYAGERWWVLLLPLATTAALTVLAFTLVGMVAAAFAISLTLRLHQEETGQRAEPLLAGSVSRTRWLSSHLVMALAGSAVATVLSGLVAGIAYGIAAGDVGAKLATVVGAAAVQLPAVWLLAAVAVGLFGLAPRFTPVVWGVLIGFVALYLLGSLAGFPQWLLDLEPFAHVPRIGRDFTAVPLLWLLAIDITLILLGALALRRRDLRC